VQNCSARLLRWLISPASSVPFLTFGFSVQFTRAVDEMNDRADFSFTYLVIHIIAIGITFRFLIQNKVTLISS
jgi:hypothetical protein